jgi:hypothetical protein
METTQQLKTVTITPEQYVKLFKEGKKPDYHFSGICGRVIRGTKPEHFERMSTEDYKRISWLLGPDALYDLIGQDSIDGMLHIGNDAEWLLYKLNDGNTFKLVVFPQLEDMVLATWENLMQIVSIQFPEIKPEILQAQIEELKKLSFDEIHAMAEFDFEEVKRFGRTHPQYFSAEILSASAATVMEVRAFLYHEIGCSRLFTGNGRGKHPAGHETSTEYLAKNRMFKEIDAVQFVDLEFDLDRLKQLAKKEEERK